MYTAPTPCYARSNLPTCGSRKREALLTHANRRMKAGLTALAAIAVLAFGASLAAGAVIESGFYSGTDSSSFDDCGFTLNIESEFSGHFVLRADNDGQAFYIKDNFSYRDVLTNAATGQWFVIRGNALFSEIKATQVRENIYEFVAIEAGQPFVIEDSAGNVIVRDRGVIRTTSLFDTLGDGLPGGEFIEETHQSVHGPHPGFADDFPFCEIAAELTGA
jgi:hypothetical protein